MREMSPHCLAGHFLEPSLSQKGMESDLLRCATNVSVRLMKREKEKGGIFEEGMRLGQGFFEVVLWPERGEMGREARGFL